MKRLKDPSDLSEDMTIPKLSKHMRDGTLSTDEINRWMQYFFRTSNSRKKTTRLIK